MQVPEKAKRAENKRKTLLESENFLRHTFTKDGIIDKILTRKAKQQSKAKQSKAKQSAVTHKQKKKKKKKKLGRTQRAPTSKAIPDREQTSELWV